MSEKDRKKHVHRYMEVEHVISYLESGELGFPSPREWEDKNDSHFLELYMRHRNVKSIFCCCLTSASETFHHWRIFGGGSIGARLSFSREALASAFEREGVIFRPVKYVPMKVLATQKYNSDDLAFIKRHGFRDEKEERAIYLPRSSSGTSERVRGVKVDRSAISRITISPFCPPKTCSAISERLRIFNLGKAGIRKSNMVDSEEWKKYGNRILGGGK
jgi:hypothetical protein